MTAPPPRGEWRFPAVVRVWLWPWESTLGWRRDANARATTVTEDYYSPTACLCYSGPWGCQNLAAAGSAGLCTPCSLQHGEEEGQALAPGQPVLIGGGTPYPMRPNHRLMCVCECWGCSGLWARSDPDPDVSASSEATWPGEESAIPRGLRRECWRLAWLLATELEIHHRFFMGRGDEVWHGHYRPGGGGRGGEVMESFLHECWAVVYGEEAIPPSFGPAYLGREVTWHRALSRMARDVLAYDPQQLQQLTQGEFGHGGAAEDADSDGWPESGMRIEPSGVMALECGVCDEQELAQGEIGGDMGGAPEDA